MEKKIKDYSIDTGFIFEKLLAKWEEFDRNFIQNDVQFALYSTLKKSKIRVYIGNEGDDELAYYRRRSDSEYKMTENPDKFPFLDFNGANEPNNKLSVFSYLDSCLINKNDEHFNLFFALQLYLTDVMEIDRFLKFQLEKSFQNNFKEYKRYIDLLCKKHDFLKNHEQIIKPFFDDFLQKDNIENIIFEKTIKPQIQNRQDIIDYSINSGFVYSELTNVNYALWKEFDVNFLDGEFRAAIYYSLTNKDIRTVTYDGKNGTYLKTREAGYEKLKEDSEKAGVFPFPHYFLILDKNDRNFKNIVCYNERCIISKYDTYFPIFFALQFYVTDIMEADSFLHFHLEKSFLNNHLEYRRFLEKICLKYKDFIAIRHEPLIKSFTKDFLQEKNTEKILEKFNKKPEKTQEKNFESGKNGVETGFEREKIENKPKIKPEKIDEIFDVLKDYFINEEQPQFKELLLTGNNAQKQLIFLDSGNKLADSFKQLKEANIIISCQKKDLENWIFNNFHYSVKGQIKKFKKRYLSDIISTNKDKCQNPIINVKLDKISGDYIISKS